MTISSLDPNVARSAEIEVAGPAALLVAKLHKLGERREHPNACSTRTRTTSTALALVLASLGLYGVLAHSVERRRHEIGVRMALGASRSDVRAMIMRHGMTLAFTGVIIGLAGAFALSRALRFLVFGATATDTVVFLAVPLLLLAVALVATWLPARPATRVEPVSSLGAT